MLMMSYFSRIYILRGQIHFNNKHAVNSTFQRQIDIIRVVNYYIEKMEFLIFQRKILLKNSKVMHKFDRLFAELDGLLGRLHQQIAIYS